MKEIRNAKLRSILNKEGIKDAVVNILDGVARAYSDDEETFNILSFSFIEGVYVAHFKQMSIQDWVSYFRKVYADGKERLQAYCERKQTTIVLH